MSKKYKMSKGSLKKLEKVDSNLAKLIKHYSTMFPLVVIEGHRTPERQLELYEAGKSKVKTSKHQSLPSRAVDIAPSPIPDEWGKKWIHRVHFYMMARGLDTMAKMYGIKIRWGGDWDSDGDFTDQTFNDLVHFELI